MVSYNLLLCSLQSSIRTIVNPVYCLAHYFLHIPLILFYNLCLGLANGSFRQVSSSQFCMHLLSLASQMRYGKLIQTFAQKEIFRNSQTSKPAKQLQVVLVIQLLKNFLVYGSRIFITAFTEDRLWILSWSRSTQFTNLKANFCIIFKYRLID